MILIFFQSLDLIISAVKIIFQTSLILQFISYLPLENIQQGICFIFENAILQKTGFQIRLDQVLTKILSTATTRRYVGFCREQILQHLNFSIYGGFETSVMRTR